MAWNAPALASDEVQVFVPGSPVDRKSTQDPSAASTVLRRSDLDSPGASSATVLTRVPGVQVQQTGSPSDLATASIRGTTSAQLPVYLAGIRLNDDLSGTADLSTVPLFMLDRVEVFRGNAPARAQQLGIAGAVFFEPRYPKGDQIRLGLDAASWGQRGGHIGLGTGSRQSQALIALRHEEAKNDYRYLDNNGTGFDASDDHWLKRENADQRTTDVWALNRWQTSTGQVIFLANGFDREQGLPDLLGAQSTQARAHLRRELLGLSSRSAIPCGSGARCDLSLAASYLSAGQDIRYSAGTFGTNSGDVMSRAHRFSQSAQLTWPVAERLSVTPNVNVAVETLDAVRVASTRMNARRLNFSGGLSAQFEPAARWLLLGVARLDTISTAADAGETGQQLPAGRVGLSYALWQTVHLVGNAGYYNRAPTLGELYGTSAVVVGNPSLDAEHGTTYDLGLRCSSASPVAAAAGEVFVFQQDLDNLVAFRRSSFGQVQPYNVGQARIRGAEFYLGLELMSVLHLDSSTTLLDPRNVTPGRLLVNDILPFRSRLTVDMRVELHTPKPVPTLGVRGARIALRGSHRGSRYQDEAGLIIIPHSTTFDLEAGVALLNAPLQFKVAIYDLFDQARFDTVGYPLPPRTFAVSAVLDWERAP